MTTTQGGAFVNDLAQQLGKAPATLTNYLRKHSPAALTKVKNANNRLANYVSGEGLADLLAHYKPTYVTPQPNLRLQELEAENASLRSRVQELEQQLQTIADEKEAHDAEVFRRNSLKHGVEITSYEQLIQLTKEEGDRFVEMGEKQSVIIDEAIELVTELIEENKAKIQNNWRQENDKRRISEETRASIRQSERNFEGQRGTVVEFRTSARSTQED